MYRQVERISIFVIKISNNSNNQQFKMNSKFRNSKNIVPTKDVDSFYPTKRKLKQPEQQQPTQSEIEVTKLRAALVQAIDQNQIMRGRVVQLQALLAAFQQQMQARQLNFARDMQNMMELVQQMKDKKIKMQENRTRSHSCGF